MIQVELVFVMGISLRSKLALESVVKPELDMIDTSWMFCYYV